MIASAVASCKHLALGHAPKPPLDDHGMEPLCELELDHRNDRQLVLVDLVLRPWRREAEGLSDHHQQLQGDARPAAQLLEGCAAEPGESIERGHVQVGERERAIPDSGSHPGRAARWPAQSSVANAP
jgi:hypothetical protein